jgi:hypothetical protein
LICLGSSTAANCVPCFEHYLKQAKTHELSNLEIQEAVELASPEKVTKTTSGKVVGEGGLIRELQLPVGLPGPFLFQSALQS